MSKFAGLALEVDRVGKMTIVHPITRQPLRDADGQEAYIDLYGADSQAARNFHRVTRQRRIDTRGRAKLTVEELEAQDVELLAALTAGWYLVGLDKAPIAVTFSAESARELYESREMSWLREQVTEFVEDRSNFSKASPAP